MHYNASINSSSSQERPMHPSENKRFPTKEKHMNIAEQSPTDFAPSSAQPFSSMAGSSALKHGRISGLVLVAGLMVATPLVAAPSLSGTTKTSASNGSTAVQLTAVETSTVRTQLNVASQLFRSFPTNKTGLPLVSQLSPARPRRTFAVAPKASLIASDTNLRASNIKASTFSTSSNAQEKTSFARLSSKRDLAVEVGGAKFIRVSDASAVTQGSGLKVETRVGAQLVPSKTDDFAPRVIAPAAPGTKVELVEMAVAKQVPQINGMKKVIKTSDLSAPQLAQPIPEWMKSSVVKVEKLEGKVAAPAGQTRVAQNPSAPPVRTPGTPVTNSDRLSNQIEVAVSTFVVLLTTTDLQTVAVADPTIADVAVVNSRAVLLNGKTTGNTSLVIVDGQKIRQYSVRVTSAPGERPVDVAAAIGIPGVTVRQLKDALILEGEVATTEESRRAAEVAGLYAAKVVNQISIRTPDGGGTTDLAAQVRELIDNPAIIVKSSGETVILSGTVDSPAVSQDAEALARIVAKNVVNQLRLPRLTVEQVRSSLGALAENPVRYENTVPGQIRDFAPLVVRETGGQLILEGTVATQAELDSIGATANRTGLAVINRVSVRPAYTAEQTFMASVAAAIGRPNVIVRGTPKRVVLEGVVADTNEAVLAEQIARGFVQPGNGQVDNMLRTPKPLQVNVDVTIAEINSSNARNLGIQYGSASLIDEQILPPTYEVVRDSEGNPVIGPNGQAARIQTSDGGITRTVNPTFNAGAALLGNTFGGFGGFTALDPFRARINALISKGKGRILSNPRTSVLSGRTATFQVGGQVPIPSGSTSNAAGTSTTIVFKDYGILLDIVPTALENGVTTLRVRTEVSQPDFANGVTPPGGGSPIPGFSRRSTVTELTVPVAGTVALSGLISSEDTKTETRVPILSKIPILGSLFKSKDFRTNQSELVIFVSPRVLPNPLEEGQLAFAGTFAVGENTNVAAQMGNPGLNVFNGGNTTIVAAPASQ
jgi:Flp pilus assembly secretin CpaC